MGAALAQIVPANPSMKTATSLYSAWCSVRGYTKYSDEQFVKHESTKHADKNGNPISQLIAHTTARGTRFRPCLTTGNQWKGPLKTKWGGSWMAPMNMTRLCLNLAYIID